MEVQVISPAPAVDFHYDSASTSPYATAPSSPQSTIPFTWEEKPGIPKQNDNSKPEDEDLSLHTVTDTDFAFGFLERHSISAADELFDCGKIKPLKPPPRLHSANDSPKSPKLMKLGFIEALSPRSRKKAFDQFDPFSEALKQTCSVHSHSDEPLHEIHQQRGRERTSKSNKSNRSHKVSRSMSPFRVSEIVIHRKRDQSQSQSQSQTQSQSSPTWYNKWNLKNLLLFRSTSEGSASTRKKNQSFSFRSSDGGEGFTAAEETSDERRKNSSVNKSGLLRCLRFNQGGSVQETMNLVRI